MVRGLFSKLQFPYTQFPCHKLLGFELYDIFWEAVERVERCGFNVLACTSDGLSVNRRFFKLHGTGSMVYKAMNPYSDDERFVYFFSDPPHLIKTVRNCWFSDKLLMWVSTCIIVHKTLCIIYIIIIVISMKVNIFSGPTSQNSTVSHALTRQHQG